MGSTFFSESHLLTASELALECDGERFVPDETIAYVEAELVHAYPVVTDYNIAFDGRVVARSYQSMRHKKVDWMHLVKRHDVERITRDRIIGSVVAVELLNPRPGEMTDDPKNGVRMRCVLGIFKDAEGVSEILGGHQTRKDPKTVSMEVSHDWPDGCFVLPEAAGIRGDIEDRAYNSRKLQLVSWKAGGAQLQALARQSSKDRVKPLEVRGVKYPVHFLAGGLENKVRFEGIGIVRFGGEPTAKIGQVLAEDPDAAKIQACLDVMGEVAEFGEAVKLAMLERGSK